MFRTGISDFRYGFWIFIAAATILFTNAEGGENSLVRFTAEPGDVIAAEGDAVRLPCAASRHVTVRWRHAHSPEPTRNHQITADDNRKILENGTLVISSMSAALAGYYQCSLTDALGTLLSRVGSVSLPVLPKFVAPPRSIITVEGSAALLPCGLEAGAHIAVAGLRRGYYKAGTGHVPPLLVNVTWLHNSVALTLEVGMTLLPNGALEVSASAPRHAGAYLCRVTAGAQSATGAVIELRVIPEEEAEAAPRFIVKPESTTALEGSTVTLVCAAAGAPAPRLEWLHDGTPLDLSLLDSRLWVSYGGSLVVSGVRASDAGTYTCRVPHASAVRAALTVQSAPRIVQSTGPSLVAPLRGTVTLKCKLKEGSAASVRWCKDGDTLTPNQRDIALDTDGSLRIMGVLGVDAGVWQCVARGPAGQATRATALHITQPDSDQKPSPLQKTQNTHTHKQKHQANKKHKKFIEKYDSVDFLSSLVSDSGTVTSDEFNREFTDDDFYDEYTLDSKLHAAQDVDLETLRSSNGTLGSIVKNLRAVIVRHRFVTLSWEDVGAMNVTGYVIVYKVKGSEREIESVVEGSKHDVIIGNLQPNTTYVFQALAYSGRAASVLSPLVEVTTSAEDTQQVVTSPGAAALGPPTNLSVTWNTKGDAVVVSWSPPAVSAPDLTGYKVRSRGAGVRPRVITLPPTVHTTELTHCTPHADQCLVRVCSVGADGAAPCGEWAGPGAAPPTKGRGIARDPPTPHQPPPIYSRAGRDWISVWWRGGPGSTSDVDGVQVGWGLGVPDDVTRPLPATATSHVIRDLQPNSEYVISLRYGNGRGLGPPVYATVRTSDEPDDGPDDGTDDEDGDEDGDQSDTFDHQLLPPIGVKAIMLSGTTAVVYWSDPTLPKGQNPVESGRRYVVRVSGPGRTKTYNATDLNLMIDDLRPHTTYEFSVQCIQDGAVSAWSMLSHNTSLSAPPAAPPRAVRVRVGARAVPSPSLTWAAPPHHANNGDITEYVVSWWAVAQSSQPGQSTLVTQPAEGGGGGGSVRVGAPATSVPLDMLRPRTTYRLVVQARNSAGLSPLSAPVLYTTPEVSEEAGGAWMSWWLWGSAGGAAGALLLGAVLATHYSRRQHHQHHEHTTYQKSAATAALKPPDLWIHHDQMELKHLDKHPSIHKMSTSSIEACGMSSAPGSMVPQTAMGPRDPRPASLDRRHYVPTYVDAWSVGSASDGTSPVRSSTANDSYNTTQYSYLSMGGVGAGCAATCDRRLRHEQSGTMLSTSSAQAAISRPNNTCGAGGAGCGGCGLAGGALYACARERGHYVAYEPVHHYTNREVESSVSECGRSQCGSALGPPQPPAHSALNPALSAPLHSFTRTDTSSERSTPTHSRGSVRETSPYKKSGSSSPGPLPPAARLHHIPSDALVRSELEPLTPSRSSERLQREMDNLEGLMRDLSDITRHHHYHCET